MATGNVEKRALTPNEIATLPPGLVAAIAAHEVELINAHHWVSKLARLIGRGTQIVVRGRRIFWPRLRSDFSADPVALSVLAHELTHIWQYANGLTLWRYILRERGVYHYRIDGRAFLAYGYEQQAAMVEDWVRLRDGLPPRWGDGVDAVALRQLIPFE